MAPNLGEYGDLLMMPAALVVCVFVFIVAIAVVGYSMKWAVNIVDAGPIGFFYGLLTAIVMSIAGGITNVAMVMLTGTQNPWVLMCYSATAGIVALALMVQCNPFKAFLAYLCNMVFSTLSMIGVVIVGALMMFMLSKANMITLPENPPAMMGGVQSGFGASSPTPVDTKFITPGGGNIQANPFGG